MSKTNILAKKNLITKSFVILAGESSCYNLLAFISLNMESHRASSLPKGLHLDAKGIFSPLEPPCCFIICNY